MTIEIRVVDPFDAAAFEAWHATYLASTRFERPDSTPWMAEEVRAELRAVTRRQRVAAWSGLVDGEVVVAGALSLPLLDNLTQATLQVDTLPTRRNRGYGSAMLVHLEQQARGHERVVLNAEASYPVDAPGDGTGHPYADFLTHRGFRFGLGDVQSAVDLPVPTDLLDDLLAKVAPHHSSYRLRSFVGAVPEAIVASFAALTASLMTEAPTGDLERELESADVGVLRENEALIAGQGRTKYNTVAVDADGEVVAYTELVMTVHDPGVVYQWGTLVRTDHRGRRLGLAVKAANLALLMRERPDARRVTTYNAEVNSHMVGVNRALGFVPVERLGEFQKRR